MNRADVVVVGSGLAGLVAALELAPAKVVLVTRESLGDGASTAWAQGGVAAALAADDSPELHASDTIAAGNGLVDAALARAIADEGPAAIQHMVDLGAQFDRAADGAFALSREAAHQRRRVAHAGGDRTGRELLRAALGALSSASHVRVLEHTTLLDLSVSGDAVDGVWLSSGGAAPWLLHAPRVVLATGGLGALYRYTTNPPGQWGAGLAIAARAGAVLADLEFVQFHPTALDTGSDPLPLISEAVRGEGARIVDSRGRSLMAGIDPRGDLAPRDMVARAVFATMRSDERAYLDATASPGAEFAQRFPGIFAACLKANVDPRVQPIPIVPAAHYHMGGIAVDAKGRSSLEGLWACGEVSATGLHGANRLASNSLLEALVFAQRVARDVASSATARRNVLRAAKLTAGLPQNGDDADAIERVRRRMFGDVGIERDAAGLRGALDALSDEGAQATTLRVRDMALVGSLIARAALARRESRGSHLRRDYPDLAPSARRSFTRLDDLLETRIPA